MCMSASYSVNGRHYFGRNLDLEISLKQEVVVTPKRYRFTFRNGRSTASHNQLIGMAVISKGYPLYFDAVNDKGLGMAGLNFPGEAHYLPPIEGKTNIASFEMIPWILIQCASVSEARDLLGNMNITDESFSEEAPATPLHWMISDAEESIVVEQTASGLNVYDNPVGILTNCPPFPYHMQNLSNYMNLSPGLPENRFSKDLDLKAYSRGMGAMGLPGDLSSASRFVKAAFTKANSVAGTGKEDGITQFFHIMDSVQQQKGCCDLGDGKYEYTVYTSCCDTENGIYYFRTYENNRIMAVNMHHADLGATVIQMFRVRTTQDIDCLN